MKKLIVTLLIIVGALGLIMPIALAYDFPSTNEDNRNNGHPHVNQIGVGVGRVTLEFVNDTNSLVTFEYRIDGVVLTSGNSHPVVTGDFIYPNICVDNRPSPAPNCIASNSEIRTFFATEKVEVRLALGGQRDWDFDWTTFFVLQDKEPEGYYLSTDKAGIVDAIGYGPEDILFYEPISDTWDLFFDGSNYGLSAAKHNINAIHLGNTIASDDLYLSFHQNRVKVPGIGIVRGQDIAHYNGSEFSLYLDGSNVGLTTVGEKIDALSILDGSLSPIGGSCQQYLLISTLGSGRVMDVNGVPLRFQGEDILGFCLTNTGADTDGFWHLFLDGSNVGLPKNSTYALSADLDTGEIYLTTKAAFALISGNHSKVYVYDMVTETFSGPVFDASVDLAQKVNALHVSFP